ncbi:hypothetical protein MMC07_008443 [Pseudocyphellaria aurata]|nr:hypothetical protein [Pseudocyphellaria aurata]
MPEDDTQFDKTKYEAYKARKDIYKTNLAKFERREKAFGDLITFIQDTIAAHNVTFIQKEEPHPWDYLRALKTCTKRRSAKSRDRTQIPQTVQKARYPEHRGMDR